jgi:hypothetical protein
VCAFEVEVGKLGYGRAEGVGGEYGRGREEINMAVEGEKSEITTE